MKPTRILTLAAAAATAFLGAVADASAATRYAAPDSAVTSGTCALESPGCRLDHAINAAGANDTVIVLPGQYNVTWPIAALQTIQVEGKAGEPRPRLLGGGGLVAATVNLTKGGTVKHLYLESTAAFSALTIKQGTVSDVEAYAQSADAVDAKAGAGLVIRDSVFHTAAGSPYAALKLTDDSNTGSIDVVNVTAVGTAAGSTGVAHGSGSPVTIVNTIARGASNDVSRTAVVPDATVSYSSYRPLSSTGVTAGLGNQATAPVFTDAAGGDFRPAAGSPTIDAGTASVTLGPDPDGTTRGAPDIGAYEFSDGGAPPTGGGTGGTTGGDPTTGSGSTTTDTASPTTDSGSSTTSDGTATDGEDGATAAFLPPAAPPVLGRSVGLGPVKGSVRVRVPGAARAVPLRAGASVPVGSVIDATKGVVALTSVRDRRGKTQTGQFWGGVFRVGQSRRGGAYTDLTLAGKPRGCRKAGARNRVNSAGRRRAARRRWSRRTLWGRDRGGRFRTRGRNGSATVRGTEWLTEDRCGGTYFRVKKGKIVVRDRAKRKSVTLKRGQRYLARGR